LSLILFDAHFLKLQRGVLANCWPRKKIVLQEDGELTAVAE
jgi:hypothetical protein